MANDAGTAPPTDMLRERGALPFGSLAFIGAIGSLITCYGRIALEAFFGVQALAINPHVQAAIMGAFGLLAIYGLWRDRKWHLRNYPLAIGTAGLLVLIGTLYIHYDTRFEVLAYILLVVGALLNQTAMVSRLYGTTLSQKRLIEDFNRDLEREVERQVGQIDRLSRLKDFLPPAVAELVVTEGREGLLESHRQYIACLFCDIRNFTHLAESLEPEETIALLQSYHASVGELVSRRNGTIGYRAGDGLMVFFNDPVPCDRPVLDAVKLALELQQEWQRMQRQWERLGHRAGIGVGIASGYATLGLVGKQGRADYTAIGNVVNLASRLCDRAADGEVLIDRRAYLDVEDDVEARLPEGTGPDEEVYRVESLRPRRPRAAGGQGAAAPR